MLLQAASRCSVKVLNVSDLHNKDQKYTLTRQDTLLASSFCEFGADLRIRSKLS